MRVLGCVKQSEISNRTIRSLFIHRTSLRLYFGVTGEGSKKLTVDISNVNETGPDPCVLRLILSSTTNVLDAYSCLKGNLLRSSSPDVFEMVENETLYYYFSTFFHLYCVSFFLVLVLYSYSVNSLLFLLSPK